MALHSVGDGMPPLHQQWVPSDPLIWTANLLDDMEPAGLIATNDN